MGMSIALLAEEESIGEKYKMATSKVGVLCQPVITLETALLSVMHAMLE